MPRLLLTLTALATAIAVAAGCGSDGSSSSGAASLAPAGSLMYGEATLSPEGAQKAAIEDLVAKFPGEGSAGERISGLMEKAFEESDGDLSYKQDIEPWLGDEAAFFVSDVGRDGEDADGALLVATEDEDAAVDAIEKDGDARRSEYRGHDMYLDEDDTANAVVDGWLLEGSEAGVKTAIDMAEGDGEPIEDDDNYRDTLDDAPDDRLGFLYVNLPGFLQELQESPGAGAVLGQLRGFFEEPFVVTADVDENGVRFEAALPESPLTSFPLMGVGSGNAGELPGDAWLGLAQPELGRGIEAYIDLAGASLGGRDRIEEQLRSATGLDLEEDVTGWMGDWAAFVRGTSVEELDGALYIETTDEAASGRFIDAVARLMRENPTPGMRLGPLALAGGGEGVTLRRPDVPRPIHLFQRDGKVVAAYGDAAARDAIDPDETLADSQDFRDAEAALGGDYPISFFVAIGPILELADSAGAASDEDWREARPYLEPLGALVGGAREDGDKVRTVLGLTVK